MIPIITSYSRRRGIAVYRLSKHQIAFLIIILLLSFAVSIFYKSSIDDGDHAKCLTSFGTYRGLIYSKLDATQHNKCLVESPWMRVSQHTVITTTTGDESITETKTIHDWLFIDYHDRINVLVESPSPPKEDENETNEKQFIIMEQTKYALDQTSLAIVGGLVEPSDVGGAIDAAKREVLEELSISCRAWKDLGKFRTDVNRGMGWVHPFLATDCFFDTSDSVAGDGDSSKYDSSKMVGARDTEKQHVRTMKLTDVRRAVMDGKFVEVQWSNTVALAMLHLSIVE